MVGMEEYSKKRSFLCSSSDLCNDEYYDDMLPEKKRRLTHEQVLRLSDV